MAEWRTKLQADADRLDLELFRALRQAEGYIKHHPHEEAFADVAISLREARSAVRKLMHESDLQPPPASGGDVK